MAATKVASRYAKSLIDLAVEQGQLEETYAQICDLDQAISDSRDFALLLKSPIVKKDKKLSIISAVFGDRFGKILMRFITIITKNNRESLLAEITESFITQYKALKKTLVADVISAVPLDDAARSRVKELVSVMDHNDIELNEKVDPALIGGLILRVGDRQIDVSVANQLNEIKKKLTNKDYIVKL